MKARGAFSSPSTTVSRWRSRPDFTHGVISATRGNQVRAAEILGLNRNTLRKKIQDLGVDVSRGRR